MVNLLTDFLGYLYLPTNAKHVFQQWCCDRSSGVLASKYIRLYPSHSAVLYPSIPKHQ